MKRFALACCLAMSFAFCAALGFRGAVYADGVAYIPGNTRFDPYSTLVINLTDLSSSEVHDSAWGSMGAAVCGDGVYIASQAGQVFRISTLNQGVTYIPTDPYLPIFSVACDPQANRLYASATDGNSPPTHYLEVIDTNSPYHWVTEYSLGVQPTDCDPTGIDVIPNAPAYGIYMGTQCGRLYCIYPNGTFYYMFPGETTAGAVSGVAALTIPSYNYVYATFSPSSGADGSVKRIDATACQFPSTGKSVTISKRTGGVNTIPYEIAITHQTESGGKYGAYVTDSANSMIRKVTINATSGVMAVAAASSDLRPEWGASNPKGIAVSPDDSSLVVCLQSGGTGYGEVDGIYIPTGQTKGYPAAQTYDPNICHGKFIAP